MRLKEFFAAVCTGLWIAAGVWGMNQFGFAAESNMHNPLWSIGAAIAFLIILMIGVAIFFAVAKESPWTWFND